MKRIMFSLMTLAVCGVTQAQTDKVYVTTKDFKGKQTITIYNRNNIEQIDLKPNAKGLTTLDSVYLVSTQGVKRGYSRNYMVDIRKDENREALLSQNSVMTMPTKLDDYTSVSAWSNRSKWNLSNVHDPSVMLAADGYYYMSQTDASYGNVHAAGNGHFYMRRSKDLFNWSPVSSLSPFAMKTIPTWVLDSVNAVRSRQSLPAITNPQYLFWAPCLRKVNDHLYRLYYCIGFDNYIKTGNPATADNFDNSWTERAYIGVMECSNPAKNNWEDKGFVICSSSDRGKNWYRSSTSDWNAYFKFNAIDPSVIITPEGEHWMIYGSWHAGLAAVQLNPETGKTLATLPESFGSSASIAPYGKLVFTRTKDSRWQASEGGEVVYHNGYYYLFMANDVLDVPYHTRVVRSTKIDGPYFSIGGVNVTANGANNLASVMTHPYRFSDDTEGGWVGISHCAVFEDGFGNYFYCSQGRKPADTYGNAYANALMVGHVRSILWNSDGWPLVMPERYGAVTQASIMEDELIGEWEHIDMGYSAGKQKVSSAMTLGDNHTITTGTWRNSSWTFNSATNKLTINGSIELLVQREVDWEASPLKITLVYAGITNSKTYWGKKK